MKRINTLSNIDKENFNIQYMMKDRETYIIWKKLEFNIDNSIYKNILDEF
ncbi:MAG: hypothetical protein RSD22_06455 [Romboutsia sp.]